MVLEGNLNTYNGCFEGRVEQGYEGNVFVIEGMNHFANRRSSAVNRQWWCGSLQKQQTGWSSDGWRFSYNGTNYALSVGSPAMSTLNQYSFNPNVWYNNICLLVKGQPEQGYHGNVITAEDMRLGR